LILGFKSFKSLGLSGKKSFSNSASSLPELIFKTALDKSNFAQSVLLMLRIFSLTSAFRFLITLDFHKSFPSKSISSNLTSLLFPSIHR
jgi:hypothetical protein